MPRLLPARYTHFSRLQNRLESTRILGGAAGGVIAAQLRGLAGEGCGWGGRDAGVLGAGRSATGRGRAARGGSGLGARGSGLAEEDSSRSSSSSNWRGASRRTRRGRAPRRGGLGAPSSSSSCRAAPRISSCKLICVIQNTFGERLRALRQKAGKSLRQLGSEVGVSAAFLSLG
jgi:hypothetical protein